MAWMFPIAPSDRLAATHTLLPPCGHRWSDLSLESWRSLRRPSLVDAVLSLLGSLGRSRLLAHDDDGQPLRALPLSLDMNSSARGGEHGSRGTVSRKWLCIDTMCPGVRTQAESASTSLGPKNIDYLRATGWRPGQCLVPPRFARPEEKDAALSDVPLL